MNYASKVMIGLTVEDLVMFAMIAAKLAIMKNLQFEDGLGLREMCGKYVAEVLEREKIGPNEIEVYSK